MSKNVDISTGNVEIVVSCRQPYMPAANIAAPHLIIRKNAATNGILSNYTLSVTNTCQPQCREAALNLYQNRDGRQLLRTDASCVPGRYELEKCGFLPNKTPKHCSFAKLICETDLQCNAKWEVFISECEAETNEGRCPDKCSKQLNATLATNFGGALADCTCTDKEDSRCIQLREVALRSCLTGNHDKDTNTLPLPRPNMHEPEESGELDNTHNFDGTHQQHTPDSAHTTLPAAAAFTLSLLSFVFVRYCLF